MNEADYITSLRQKLADDIQYFDRVNQLYRERCVVAATLRCIRVPFADDELLKGNDPPDVVFRNAPFEVLVKYDEGRKMQKEYQDELATASKAEAIQDMMTPYSPPASKTALEFFGGISNYIKEKKYNKYLDGNTKPSELNLVLYVNESISLSDRIDSKVNCPLSDQDWISVTLLFNRGVVCQHRCVYIPVASEHAPQYIKENAQKILCFTEETDCFELEGCLTNKATRT